MYTYVVDVYVKCLKNMVFDVDVTTLCCEIMYRNTISMLEFNVSTVHFVMLIIVLMRRVMYNISVTYSI